MHEIYPQAVANHFVSDGSIEKCLWVSGIIE